jgi:hypothetical protein
MIFSKLSIAPPVYLVALALLTAACSSESSTPKSSGKIILNCKGHSTIAMSVMSEGKMQTLPGELKEQAIGFILEPNERTILIGPSRKPLCAQPSCLDVSDGMFKVTEKQKKDGADTVSIILTIDRNTGDIGYTRITAHGEKQSLVSEYRFTGKCGKGAEIEEAVLKF